MIKRILLFFNAIVFCVAPLSASAQTAAKESPDRLVLILDAEVLLRIFQPYHLATPSSLCEGVS